MSADPALEAIFQRLADRPKNDDAPAKRERNWKNLKPESYQYFGPYLREGPCSHTKAVWNCRACIRSSRRKIREGIS